MVKSERICIKRAIRSSIGRFLSIAAIVALGVGFLVGLLSGTPDMHASLDQLYQTERMSDLWIMDSQTGLSKGEQIAIQALPCIRAVLPVHVADQPVRIGSDSVTARIEYLTFGDGALPVNRLTLAEGRMPASPSECVVQRPQSEMYAVGIGDTIYLDSGKTLYVTGTVTNPFYIANEREVSMIGSGRVDLIAYTERADEPVNLIYCTVTGADEQAAFTDAYQRLVDDAADQIRGLGLDDGGRRQILDRQSNLSAVSYHTNMDKIADIAKVVPIFFFLVTMLVTLTAMTRMVEEERIQIGTFKALGYGNGAIFAQYAVYSGLATLTGCMLGLACGCWVLPLGIYAAYETLYDLPPLVLRFDGLLAALACGAELICALLAAGFACRRALREKPAALMLPRVPKPGQRILLERVRPLWRRLSFSSKATARNVFRNKKNLILTVVGVAGCAALMVAALGLRDSVRVCTDTQFESLQHEDAVVTLSGDISIELPEGAVSLAVQTSTVTVSAGDQSLQMDALVVEDPEAFPAFQTLRNRKTGKPIDMDENAVVLSEKAAETLGVSVGDAVRVKETAGEEKQLIVTGIAENYVGACLWLGSRTGITGQSARLLRTGLTTDAERETASEALLAQPGVLAVEWTAQTKTAYERLLKSLDAVVLLIVACAGALAVIVLYQITNVNISERTKELATLRVLGYRHGETARYVFREIWLQTILGLCAGLPLGVLLHAYVVRVADSPDMMLGRSISAGSFLIAAAASLCFSGLVDLLMLRRLHRINMAESLKAAD